MTKETTSFTGKSPDYIAYQLRENGEKSYQTRVGVAWAHKDYKGVSLHLDVIPLDGKVQLRMASDKE